MTESSGWEEFAVLLKVNAQNSVMDCEEVLCVWGCSQLGVNFTAGCGLELPTELIWLSRQPTYRMRKGQGFLPLQTSFLHLRAMSCITAGVRGLCRNETRQPNASLQWRWVWWGRKHSSSAQHFNLFVHFLEFANAARSGHCTQGLVLELPKQQFSSKAANSWLAEGTGPWVWGKKEKLFCVYDSVTEGKKKKCEFILVTAVVRMRRSYCFMKSWVITQDTAHPAAQIFLWKVLPSNCHKLIFIWVTRSPGN